MKLYILNGDREGECLPLRPGTCTIGRAAACDIVLTTDGFVSGTHTEITLAPDDTVTIRDAGSTNGTFLLGESVQQPMQVKPGDIFRVGRTFFKLSRRKRESFEDDNDEDCRRPEAVVVVDIVGSSKIAHAMGDAAAAKIKDSLTSAIDRQLTTYPAEYRKSTGDGYLIIFNRAEDAVWFAQGLLMDKQGSGSLSGYHVRVGINYGETIRLSDGDRRGMAVDMAFRIEAVKPADMHQTVAGIRKDELPRIDRILISEVVQNLIARKPAIETRCIGFFDLKGFTGRHRLFEVLY